MLSAEDILTGARWKILEVLAQEGPKSATDIAEAAEITLPAVSQSIKLLEAYGYVVAKQIKKNRGKPRIVYLLKKPVAHLTICVEGCAHKCAILPDKLQAAALRAYALPAEDQYWMQKLLWSHDHLLDMCSAIAYVRTEKDETHLLVLSENVEEYRKEYSSIVLTSGKLKRKVISWSHTYEEAREGLAREEKYFVELFAGAHIIYDPEHILRNLKGG